jgi:hypothetical protein
MLFADTSLNGRDTSGHQPSMKTVLYCRVSTRDQTVEHQRTQARQNGFKPDLVLADHGISGVSTRLCERAEGRRLFDILREGDTLVVRWVDRLGRGSAKRRQGDSASGRSVKDCLWLDTAASDSRRMVTTCRRGSLPAGFRPSRAEAYQCGNLDLPPKRCPCPDRHTVGPLGRPPDASPVPLGRVLVRRFRWSAHSPSAAVQNGDFAPNCFYMSCVGRKGPNRQTACLPERGNRADATEWAAHRPSRK